MNKKTLLLLSSLLGSSISASGALFVGWEVWDGVTTTSTSEPASLTMGGLSGSVAGVPASGANISTFTNATADNAASADGTFGPLSTPAADTSITGGAGIVVASGGEGYFDFTVNYTGATDVDLTTFSFDAGAFRPNASRDWELSVQSGSLTTGSVATSSAPVDHSGGGGGMNSLSNWNYDVDLSGLTDNTLANGESVVFRLNWTGGTAQGGHHLMLDNVGITAVPEPSTIALLLGTAALAFVGYRRRSRR